MSNTEYASMENQFWMCSFSRENDQTDIFRYKSKYHFPIQIEITGTSREPQKKQEEYYSYCNCDFDYLNEPIANNPFDPYCYSSVDKNTDLWYEWIFHLIEKTATRRTQRRQELPPWLSSEMSHKLNKFRTLRRKSERCVNFSPYLATQLIELEKHCANLQERDRQEYEEELISSRNRSRIFKYLKNFQKEKFPAKIVHLDWNSVHKTAKKKQSYSTRISHQYLLMKVTNSLMLHLFSKLVDRKWTLPRRRSPKNWKFWLSQKVEAQMAFPQFCLGKLHKLFPNWIKVCSTILEGYTVFPVHGSMVWSHQSSQIVIKVKVKWKIIDLSHFSTSYPKFLRS